MNLEDIENVDPGGPASHRREHQETGGGDGHRGIKIAR
jgi:hypothetical protein